MNILVVGHACAPGLGSEPSNTWNWAWQMSRTHQVWVIAHPEFKSFVDDYLPSHPNPNIHFVWLTVNSRFDRWKPGTGQERGIRLHYWLWIKEAYKRAAELHKEVRFNLVHHVSWSTIAVPPPFWRVPVPAFWGPIGGGQTFPVAFLSHLKHNRLKEFLRSTNLFMLPYSPGLRRTLKHTSLVLATNFETRDLLKRAGAKKVGTFLDCGVDEPPAPVPPRNTGGKLKLLWAGRMEPQKGLAIALRAMAKCTYQNAVLLVAGSGGEQEKLQALAKELDLKDRVQFLGRIPHEKMTELFLDCHALVFTALRDSFGSVLLEAMSNGLPIIALNHQGVQAFVPEDAAIKVPAHSPEQVISDLAKAFETLGNSPQKQIAMSQAALSFAEQQTWEHRAQAMNALYEETLAAGKIEKR